MKKLVLPTSFYARNSTADCHLSPSNGMTLNIVKIPFPYNVVWRTMSHDQVAPVLTAHHAMLYRLGLFVSSQICPIHLPLVQSHLRGYQSDAYHCLDP